MGSFRDGYRDGDESSSEEEDPTRKTPFAAELKQARHRLSKARRSGDEVQEGSALLEMGEVKLRSAKYARASQRAEEAMMVFPQAEEKAEAVRLMVRVHLGEGKVHEAHKLLELKMVAFHRSPRSPRAIAILRLTRADVCLAMERPVQALREANDALREFQAQGDEARTALAERVVAGINLKLGKPRQFRKGLGHAERSLKYYKNSGDWDEEAVTLLLVSKLHLELQENEDAILFAKVAAEVSRPKNALSREAAAQNQLALILLSQNGDPEQAGSLAKQAVTKCRKNGDYLGEIDSHQVVAKAYQKEGLVNMALEALDEALVLARKVGHRTLISILLDSMIKVYDPDGALVVLRKEEDLARRSGDAKRELDAMRRVVIQQLNMERYGDASKTAAEIVDFARSVRDWWCEAQAMQLVGEVSHATGEVDEAFDGLFHARSLYQEADDVRGQVAVLEKIRQIHAEQTDQDGGATSTKAQQQAVTDLEQMQKIYQEAGWREMQAQTAMELAKTQCKVRGAIRAVQTAKDAIELYGQEDDEGKAFAARGSLDLAEMMKGSVRYNKELPHSIDKAKELYRQIEDAEGWVSAQRATADMAVQGEDHDEAAKIMQDAINVCQDMGDPRAQADAALQVVDLRMQKIQYITDKRKEVTSQMLQDAIDAAIEAVPLFRAIGDVEKQISMLLIVSGLYIDKEEGEDAHIHAEEALELSVKETNRFYEAHALLNIAKAHYYLGESEESQNTAIGAREFFEQLGDEDGIDKATEVIEFAKHAPREKQPRRKGAKRQPVPQRTAPEQVASRLSGKSRDKGGFSARMEKAIEEIEKDNRREELLTRKVDTSAPDQELKRRQLYEACAEAPSGQVMESEPQELSFPGLLQSVKPDWKEKDIKNVQDKFSKIDIKSAQDLYEALQVDGPKGINARLKQVKQKPMMSETLERIFVTLDALYHGRGVG